ncbi:putative amidophosphoribosyltransferase [Candidatus Protochlamydia naegleriophila]|uniref:Putative amidophosphoribosyltransferase n=1 Tax=Candidatus Protochlamydia naegleriophila TaxID=389348 RepID=A0A0U5EPU8_9BACT|nr:ComF family protein [Candidatus Protochlamydia naegleriophila]CUI16067.1 putative amidophosphoribosyltransferase [Candidatus Protochlamydia naegleriophila]
MSNARRLWQELKHSCLHLCFPARCLHCKDVLPPQQSIFCNSCASLLELIDPEGRCQTCFSVKEEMSHDCLICKRYPSLFLRKAAAFDYLGPPSILVRQLKYANQPYLAKGMGAFLFAQFERLEWPLPDALVPVPLSFSHWLQRGYNQSLLLAEELGKLMNIPVWNALKRTSSDYSQAALALKQRKSLGHAFKLQSNCCLLDKKILVIDDVMTSGSTLHRCAEALSEGFPSLLYAMTFCRTIES